MGSAQVNVTVASASSRDFTVQAQIIFSVLLRLQRKFVRNCGARRLQPGGTIRPVSGRDHSARPEEVIELFANGFGPVLPPVISGSASQMGSLPSLPLVAIGGVPAMVQFAGLVSPGLYQFNVVVPASANDGDNSITATYNGVATQAGTLLTVRTLSGLWQ